MAKIPSVYTNLFSHSFNMSTSKVSLIMQPLYQHSTYNEQTYVRSVNFFFPECPMKKLTSLSFNVCKIHWNNLA